jgi:hypothetical protein
MAEQTEERDIKKGKVINLCQCSSEEALGQKRIIRGHERDYGGVAGEAEHQLYKLHVVGSNPSTGYLLFLIFKMCTPS